MYNILLVFHVIVTVALIGIILMQRSASDGLGGMGGGSAGGGGLISARAQANLLTRTTAILATLFILNSLGLSWLTQQNAPSRSIVERVLEQETLAPSVPLPEDAGTPSPVPTQPIEQKVPHAAPQPDAVAPATDTAPEAPSVPTPDATDAPAAETPAESIPTTNVPLPQ